MRAMPLVDPNDDSVLRFVLEHFRYDPERHQRRNVVVAAYDNEPEFLRAFSELNAELAKGKQDGSVESNESISGRVKPPGSSSAARERRAAWRRATRGLPPTPENQ